MANKTPPLVIPVVIDSTGVNKGISDINSRLRTGVGGSVGGGSTPGVGGGSFGGGGGAAEAILGGAIAGGIAARTGRGGGGASGGGGSGGMSPELQNLHNRTKRELNIRNDNFVSRFFQRRAASNFQRAVDFNAYADVIAPGMRAGGITVRAGATPLSRAFDENARRFQQRGKMMGSFAAASGRAGIAGQYAAAGIVSAAGGAGRKGMKMLGGLSGLNPGSMIGGLGAAAAAAGTIRTLRGGGRGDVSELAGLVGSTDYGYLRGMQNRAPSGVPLSVMNSVKLGMAKQAGMGVPTQFEIQSNAFNNAIKATGEMIGSFYEWQAQTRRDLIVGVYLQFQEASQRKATN